MSLRETLERIRSDPVPNNEEEAKFQQTAAGHFVNVNLSAREIRTRAVQFMEALGHRESDLEYLYE